MVDELPDALAVAMRLHDAHYGPSVIATALGVPEQSTSIVLKVARLKLEAIAASGDHAPQPTLTGG